MTPLDCLFVANLCFCFVRSGCDLAFLCASLIVKCLCIIRTLFIAGICSSAPILVNEFIYTGPIYILLTECRAIQHTAVLGLYTL